MENINLELWMSLNTDTYSITYRSLKYPSWQDFQRIFVCIYFVYVFVYSHTDKSHWQATITRLVPNIPVIHYGDNTRLPPIVDNPGQSSSILFIVLIFIAFFTLFFTLFYFITSFSLLSLLFHKLVNPYGISTTTSS